MPSRHTKVLRSRKETTLLVFLSGLVIAWLIVAVLSLPGTDSTDDSTSVQVARQRLLDAQRDGAPPVIGQHAIISRQDRQTEVVYALPKNVRGTALLLHGCSHSALKFFSPSPVCQSCIGLSEELRIARILVGRDALGVVAITSQDRKSGCWSDRDIPHIQDVLDHFQFQRHVPGRTVPILAFGASSGGRFAAQLAVRDIVDAAFVGVMSLGSEIVQKWNAMPKKPPIYLAPMPRDQSTLRGNQQDFASMKGHGPVLLDVTTCQAIPVTASFLNERVPHIKPAMASQIISALVASGHLDSHSSMLLKDPTRSDWRDVLQNLCGAQGCLQNQPLGPGVSPLAKALHRSWAFHEYCSEATLKALNFFHQEIGE